MWAASGGAAVGDATGWNPNAKEFVPGGGDIRPPAESGGSKTSAMGGAGAGASGQYGGFVMNPNYMYAGKGSGMPWVPGTWKGMQGQEAWMHSNVWSQFVGQARKETGAVAAELPTKRPPEPPKGFAAMWNLEASYTEETLTRDLAEVDFEPECVTKMKDCEGAFALVFREAYMAAAITIALNNIDPDRGVVRHSDERLRVAQWNGSSWDGSEDQVPGNIISGMMIIIKPWMVAKKG